MPTLNDAKNMSLAILLTNTTLPEGLYATPLLTGRQGIGKTTIAKNICEEINGTFVVLDGSTAKEGDVSGIPFLTKDEKDKTIFKFVEHYTTKMIKDREDDLYTKMLSDKEFQGKISEIIKSVKFNFNKEDKVENVLNIETAQDCKKLIDSVSSQEKVDLMLKKAIAPIVYVIDEINRCPMEVMKELMNVLLNRNIHDYKFPWWVFIMGTRNPSDGFCVNEMDPAQLDRVYDIRVAPNHEEFLDYAIEKKFHPDIIDWVADDPKIITSVTSVDTLDDSINEMDASASPRGIEQVSHLLYLYDNEHVQNKLFSDVSKSRMYNNLRESIQGKLGRNATTAFFTFLDDSEKNFKISEMLDGKNKNVNKEIVRKIEAMSSVRKTALTHKVIDYLLEHRPLTINDKKTKDKDSPFIKQLEEFISLLEDNNRIVFFRKLSAKEHNAKLMGYCRIFLKELEKVNNLTKTIGE